MQEQVMVTAAVILPFARPPITEQYQINYYSDRSRGRRTHPSPFLNKAVTMSSPRNDRQLQLSRASKCASSLSFRGVWLPTCTANMGRGTNPSPWKCPTSLTLASHETTISNKGNSLEPANVRGAPRNVFDQAVSKNQF